MQRILRLRQCPTNFTSEREGFVRVGVLTASNSSPMIAEFVTFLVSRTHGAAVATQTPYIGGRHGSFDAFWAIGQVSSTTSRRGRRSWCVLVGGRHKMLWFHDSLHRDIGRTVVYMIRGKVIRHRNLRRRLEFGRCSMKSELRRHILRYEATRTRTEFGGSSLCVLQTNAPKALFQKRRSGGESFCGCTLWSFRLHA